MKTKVGDNGMVRIGESYYRKQPGGDLKKVQGPSLPVDGAYRSEARRTWERSVGFTRDR